MMSFEEKIPKDLREIRVSFFGSITAQKPVREILLHELLEHTQLENWKQPVEGLRQLYQRDQDAYKERKKTLPAFTASGTCTDRKSLKQHTGLLQIDLDAADNPGLEPAKVRDGLINDSHMVATWISPSGAGVKGLLRIPPDVKAHEQSFAAVEAYLRRTYSYQLDRATKDPLRLCFVSHDPELRTNPDAVELVLERSSKSTPLFRSEDANLPLFTNEDTQVRVEQALGILSADCGHADWVKIGMALKAGGIAFETWDRWSAPSTKYPGSDKARKKWNSFQKEGVTLGTLFHLAQLTGDKVGEVPVSPVPAEPSGLKTRGEATPWVRRDLRSGLYHIRAAEAANAFRGTGISLEDPILEQKLIEFLKNPPGGELVKDTLDKKVVDNVLYFVRMQDRGARTLELLAASDLKPIALDWLWEGWLAQGKLHLLAGAPGTGKTTLSLKLAATITTGGQWPDGSECPVGNVLIWSGEDDPKDTLIPRLSLAGADLNRIRIIGDIKDRLGTRGFDPASDLPILKKQIQQSESFRLLIMDPIVAAVTGDSHRNTEVRRALQPLVELGQSHNCAIIGITHFSKGGMARDPLDRVTGSVAFGALARVVLGTAVVPDEDTGASKRLMLRLKSNIGPDTDGFSYTLEQADVETFPGIQASMVRWGEQIFGEARMILEEEEKAQDNRSPNARQEAQEFLKDLLAKQSVSALGIREEAAEAGIAWATIRRAAKDLEVIKEKKGLPGEKGWWEWRLPTIFPIIAADA